MPSEKGKHVSRARWLAAQEQEQKALERADVRELIRIRRHTWAILLDSLKDVIEVESSKRILEVGGGPTSIFLALRAGEKYVVDPLSEQLFRLHPFVREVEEYKDVNFIARPISEATFDRPFDLIFMINVLDHVDELNSVAKKIDELLTPSGKLIVTVSCYSDPMVKNLVNFFDVDLPHPHHFIAEDITGLFSNYKLIKQDSNIWKINIEPARGERKEEIKIYRLDKFISLMHQHLKEEGEGVFFAFKYFMCYSLALLVAATRRREQPIYPIKKDRLFVFQKKTPS